MWSLSVATILCCLGVATSVVVPTKVLNDGNKIPVLALGTSGSAKDRARMRQTINWAVEAGYRHIDTASLYRNEQQIGEGIRDVINRGLVKREDIFVTTKLWNDRHSRDQVVPALRESLQRLGLDYVDLYLIHSPAAINADGSPSDIDYLETWGGMEEAQRLGLTKSIGVSNFENDQIDRLLASGNVKPAVNQIEVHPTLTNHPIADHCLSLGIDVMGYSAPAARRRPRAGGDCAQVRQDYSASSFEISDRPTHYTDPKIDEQATSRREHQRFRLPTYARGDKYHRWLQQEQSNLRIKDY